MGIISENSVGLNTSFVICLKHLKSQMQPSEIFFNNLLFNLIFKWLSFSSIISISSSTKLNFSILPFNETIFSPSIFIILLIIVFSSTFVTEVYFKGANWKESSIFLTMRELNI